MNQPARILHVLGGVSLGGAESRIMDLYRCMDRDEIQFDFLVHSDDLNARKPEFYDEEIKALGGRIFVLPRFKVYNYIAYKKAVEDFFKNHREFVLVQGHMTSTAALYLPVAKKAGVPIVAAHARSAGVDKGIKGIITRCLRIPLLKRADYCLACSKEAGEAVFGKKWEKSGKAVVLPNAIASEKYIFNRDEREKIREELGIQESYVIGHVGRFHYAKNHEFLLEIFSALHSRMKERNMRAVLLLLGDGAGMKAIKEQAEELRLNEDVLFMGNKKDVENYYQAMDYFVFPSRFEGLPGTVVEAQAAGLRCIISDTITPEVGFTELVHYESIEKPADIWAEHIMRNASYERTNMHEVIKQAGFDVMEQAVKVEGFYKTGKI
ncbi:MAG: glycosyltransferase family 1 protein [Clostridiales bacterium]|nr:glycosyltransferase family 1 protein [Clostridiales bacterium]